MKLGMSLVVVVYIVMMCCKLVGGYQHFGGTFATIFRALTSKTLIPMYWTAAWSHNLEDNNEFSPP
jgi:type IV secretory pathway TrbL component